MAETIEEKLLKNAQSLEEWELAGISRKDMAETLNVSYSQFRKVLKENSALSALMKKSADARKGLLKEQIKNVEGSLYKRALGYEAEVTEDVKLKVTKFTEAGRPYVDEVLQPARRTVHVPADVQAIKFFLLNKAKKDYKNDPDRADIDRARLRNDNKRVALVEKEVQAKLAAGDTGDVTVELGEAADWAR